MDMSLFEDEWKACLRAHYDHVVREQDQNNETSLISVLLQTGFTDEEIETMRAETLASLGWQSDEDVIESEPEPIEDVIEEIPDPVEQIPAPAESEIAGAELFEPPVVPEVIESVELSEPNQTLETAEVQAELFAEEQAEDEPPEPEGFTQLSMF